VFLPAVGIVGFTSVMAQILVPFAATLSDPASRGRVVGTVMSGLLLGILLARTASGLIAQVAGWRGVYLIFAVLMVAQMVTLWSVLPTYRADVRLGYGRLLVSVAVIARQEPVLRLRAVFGVVSFASFSVLWTVLAFLLSGPPYNYSEGVIGLFGLVGAAGAVTANVVGRFTDRGWARALTGISTLLLLLGVVLLWRGAVSLPALLAGVLVLDVGSTGLHLSNQSEIFRIRPEARSRVNAFYMTSCFVGAAGGSAVAAFVYERWGWDGVCVLGAAIALSGLALWAFGPRHSAAAQE
jgi:predicted MFS family arabinose efflux permease